jgi:hypothetical protein
MSIYFDVGACIMHWNEGKYSYIQNSSRCIKESHRLKELVK